MKATCEVEVRVPSGITVGARVFAPAGVTDEPGTPFAVAYSPAPLILVGSRPFSGMLEGRVSRGGSVVVIEDNVEPADVLEVASHLGITQFWLAGPDVDEARALARILAVEPVRRHRPLVTFGELGPQVRETSTALVVRRATMDDEPAVQAMYDHLLDSCDVPGTETCGWKRGYWPLPNDVRNRIEAGTTWVAQDAAASGPGDAVLGAMSLDGDLGLPDVELPLAPLEPGEWLTCHLLAVDPTARGRGVATALLAAYAREGIARGCKALRINTSPQSLSNNLYHELGFVLHRPVWFPYEGLPLTGWTNVYELRLDGESIVPQDDPAEPRADAAASRAVCRASHTEDAAPRASTTSPDGESVR